MRDRLQKAFSGVCAEEELKTRTLEAIYAPARRRRRYPLIWAAACLVILLGLGGGLFFTPVSAIGIEINPSLKLSINRFDLVIGVEGLNKDGKRIAENTQLIFTEYSQAIDKLITDSQMQAYLQQGKEMDIYVECSDEQRSTEMLAKVENCVGEGQNINCHAGRSSGHGEGHGNCRRHRGGGNCEETE